MTHAFAFCTYTRLNSESYRFRHHDRRHHHICGTNGSHLFQLLYELYGKAKDTLKRDVNTVVVLVPAVFIGKIFQSAALLLPKLPRW